MLKYVLCAFGTLFLVHISKAQTEVDSLQKVIAKGQRDTVQVNAYIQFFQTDLFFDAPQKVIAYLHKARTLGEEIDYLQGTIAAHNNLGYIFRTQSETDSALFHYNTAIAKAEAIDFYKGLTDAHIGLGNTNNQLSKWEKALLHFQTVIDLARKEGDSIQIGSAYNNIGNSYLSRSMYELALESYQQSIAMGDASIRGVALINTAVVHNQMGNLDQARRYFKRSKEDAIQLNKRGHIAFIDKNLGTLEKKSGNYKEAIGYFTAALEHYEAISDDYNSSEATQNLGNVYFELKNYTKALEHYEKSLAVQRKINYASGACYNLLFMSKVYKELGAVDKAIQTLKEVEGCSDTLSLIPIKSDAAELMSAFLKKQGRYKEALEYHMNFKTLSDSLGAQSSAEKIAELDTKYQTAQKEQEIKLLNTENEIAQLQIGQQHNLRNYLILLSVILAILAFAIYSRFIVKTRTNKKLRELDVLKNSFYTNISHEFRTPLTLVLNPLDKILNSKVNESTKHDAKIAHQNASYLLELTNQMLDLSKLEAGKMQLQVSEHPINEFLEITAASFDSLAISRDITFKTDFKTDADTAFFDLDKLQKIINNLLSNAFKFTPSGGSVFLNTLLENHILKIRVRDTGIGLTEEEQKAIFDRFNQVAQNLTVGGTGVGLTLTQELCSLHHGRITVESEKDKGSSFTVEIPVEIAAYNAIEITQGGSTITKEIPKRAPLINGHNRQIQSNGQHIALVVEDNEELRSYIGELLQEEYSVHYGVDGKDGLQKAMKLIPDIVISDWMMPEMDGGALCETLKKDERTSHVPVILLTAKADQNSRLEGLGTGADAYLSKPFNNEELLIRTKNLIEQRTLLRAKYSETLLIEPTKVSLADPDKEFMERAIAIVDSHIGDGQFTVEQFQKEIGMSRTQLHRKLKALVDQSASGFIRNLRLQRAAEMIRQNKLQISEIAYQCGFNNLSYFGQCFKEKFGVPPSQFT